MTRVSKPFAANKQGIFWSKPVYHIHKLLQPQFPCAPTSGLPDFRTPQLPVYFHLPNLINNFHHGKRT